MKFKEKIHFFVVYFYKPDRAAMEKSCLTGLLAYSKNQNWLKAWT